MVIVMAIGLYATRFLVNGLGLIDYGIYSVVGGIIVMFSFLSQSMASASQRFFAFEIGKKESNTFRQTFHMTILVYFILAVVILILSETLGLWFLNHKMDIPEERMTAANWVYQFTVISFIISIFSIPYNAVVFAFEDMKVYATISIVEVILKFSAAFSLNYFLQDKLKLYALMLVFISFTVFLVYRIICHKKYLSHKVKFAINGRILKELLGYSGWNLLGSSSAVINRYGIDLLLNVFFGPLVNAARSIALQLSAAINQIALSFFNAVRPQITKKYAAGSLNEMSSLVILSSKLSFFLVFLVVQPVLFNTEFILLKWIKNIPEFTVIFTRLAALNVLVDVISIPLLASIQATGNIKKYQILIGGTLLLKLPVSYIFLKLGYEPQVTIIVSIFVSFVALILRMFIVFPIVKFSIRNYIQRTLLPVTLVVIFASVIPLLFYYLHGGLSWIGIAVSIISSVLAILFVGFNSKERKVAIQIVKSKL